MGLPKTSPKEDTAMRRRREIQLHIHWHQKGYLCKHNLSSIEPNVIKARFVFKNHAKIHWRSSTKLMEVSLYLCTQLWGVYLFLLVRGAPTTVEMEMNYCSWIFSIGRTCESATTTQCTINWPGKKETYPNNAYKLFLFNTQVVIVT